MPARLTFLDEVPNRIAFSKTGACRSIRREMGSAPKDARPPRSDSPGRNTDPPAPHKPGPPIAPILMGVA